MLVGTIILRQINGSESRKDNFNYSTGIDFASFISSFSSYLFCKLFLSTAMDIKAQAVLVQCRLGTDKPGTIALRSMASGNRAVNVAFGVLFLSP